MKYYYQKPKQWIGAGETYVCDHPLFTRCTLFREGIKGLIIIQEHFHPIKKTRWWGPIEPWIAGDIYTHEGFKCFFEENAGEPDENGVYPTFKLRQVMWSLRMKPIRKEFWEE